MVKYLIKSDILDILDHAKKLSVDLYSAKQYEDMIEDKLYQAYIIRKENSLIGWCCFQCLYDEVTLLMIAVTEENQQLGYGTILLNQVCQSALEKGCQSIILEVNEHNHKAIQFYQKHGFEINRIRKNYYVDGHGYEMIKKLSS